MPIRKKLSYLLLFSSLIPLMVFGAMAMRKAVAAQYETISQGNALVARRSAEQIGQYVMTITNVLRALSENINRPGLTRGLQESIIRNYIINFRQFQELSLVNDRGNEVITQGIVSAERGPAREAAIRRALRGEEAHSDVFVTQAMTPAMFMAAPLKKLTGVSGALVAQVNLVEMWNLVDSLRIGRKGHALVASASGLLIAHGEGAGKAQVLQGKNVGDMEAVMSALAGKSWAGVYQDDASREVLGVSSPVPGTGWAVVIEQPTVEAYLPARSIGFQLAGLAVVFLIASFAAGFMLSKDIVAPIHNLMAGARAIASGDLNARVDIQSGDEMGALGHTFNEMAGRLIQLQEDVRQKERAAVFGRVAQGLVHDLKNPMTGIQMALTTLKKSSGNGEYLSLFKKNMEEAVTYINTLLDNLKNIYKAPALAPVALNLDREISACVDGFEGEAKAKGVDIIQWGTENGVVVRADAFAFKRVVNNIVRNAIEAMPRGGTLNIRVAEDDGKIRVSFSDTGLGIPRDKLQACFTEFMTTKKKGLGLGLVICKRLMEEMGGGIAVESEAGKGAIFTLTFSRAEKHGPQ